MTTVGYIIVALLVFGLMIFIHELGHFLVARACGVCVHEFSMGMGPKIFGWKGKKGTSYNLRLFPLGGFVSMKGEDEAAEGEDSFSQKRPWQKFLIVAAGASMNILLALLLMLMLVLLTPNLASTVVYSFGDGATSSAWLQSGDRIVEVNGSKTHTGNEVVYEIAHDGYKPVDLVVVRGGQTLTLSGVVFPTQISSGMVYGKMDFVVYAEAKNIGTVLKHTFFRSLSTVKMIWESLLDLVGGRVGMEAVSGPVGVTTAISDAAKSGFTQLLYLVCVLSMNLGVFNLLPLPALDGGRLVFILWEMIAGKPVNPKYEGMVHFIGILVLFGLMILITYKDIVNLFG